MTIQITGALRRAVVAEFERGAGRHDDPAIYGGPEGDPGLIGPGSVSWRLHADLAVVALAGTAAILLEVMHPSVIAGVEENSSFRKDPAGRSTATLGYVLATTFGNTEAATALIARVKRIHGFVNGVRPDGVPYDALDPELIAWVHTCIPWMIMRVYEEVREPLTPAERDGYLAEQAVIGLMGGADAVPTTMAELDDYIEVMRPKLAVNAQTRAFIDFLSDSPLSLQLPSASARRAVASFGMHASLLFAPGWVREMTGLHRPYPLTAPLMRPVLRGDAALLRWALGTPAYLSLAQARLAGGSSTEAAAAGDAASRAASRTRTAAATRTRQSGRTLMT